MEKKYPVNLTSWGKGSFSQYENRVSYMWWWFSRQNSEPSTVWNTWRSWGTSSTSKVLAKVAGYVIVPSRVSIPKLIFSKEILPWTHPKIQSHPLQQVKHWQVASPNHPSICLKKMTTVIPKPECFGAFGGGNNCRYQFTIIRGKFILTKILGYSQVINFCPDPSIAIRSCQTNSSPLKNAGFQ